MLSRQQHRASERSLLETAKVGAAFNKPTSLAKGEIESRNVASKFLPPCGLVQQYLGSTPVYKSGEFFEYEYSVPYGTIGINYRGSRAIDCSVEFKIPFASYYDVLHSAGILRMTCPFGINPHQLLFNANLGNSVTSDASLINVTIFLPKGQNRVGWILRFLPASQP
jgi:hypothetical protein